MVNSSIPQFPVIWINSSTSALRTDFEQLLANNKYIRAFVAEAGNGARQVSQLGSVTA